MQIRKTVMLDSELVQKIHDIQAEHIKKHNKSYSFSTACSDLIVKGLG